MTNQLQHGIEGLSDDPKYWSTKAEREELTTSIDKLVSTIVDAVRPYHRHADDACISDVLRIEFENMDTYTLTALARALKA
jgi:hypothetical protein